MEERVGERRRVHPQSHGLLPIELDDPLSPSDGERVSEGGVRGIRFMAPMRVKSWRWKLSMNLAFVAADVRRRTFAIFRPIRLLTSAATRPVRSLARAPEILQIPGSNAGATPSNES